MKFGGMDADQVVRVIDWLDGRSVVYQVNGGWAVDALFGSQSRTHGDLDVFVDATEVDPLIEWLFGRGYEVVEDWRPIRVELRSGYELRREDHHDLELLRDLGEGRG